MGRIQSSVGLVTGTNIQGTVDQLIQVSARPRDRLINRTNQLREEQAAINNLTAMVIGVQLAGGGLSNPSLFDSKSASSSNKSAVSVSAGDRVATGEYTVRTLAKAATHSVTSRRRFEGPDEALGFEGRLSISPSGFLDDTVQLSSLNDGRGVEAGVIRITDRSGSSAEIDLSDARTIDDVIESINDADVDVTATTVGGAIKLIDGTGSTDANLQVEQLGDAETAADLGLWGIDESSDSVVGTAIDLPEGVTTLRGVPLDELGGVEGLATLGTLVVTLSDDSTASIDLSSATSTGEVIDAIEASGLDLIVGLNDARNGFRIRDVSGGENNLRISSSDDTAAAIGLAADTSDRIVVGENLQRTTVSADTLLSDLNGGVGVGKGSFKITDSLGESAAINLSVDEIETIGDLVDAINDQEIGVTASINDAGDGITIVDEAGGEETLTIEDVGSGEVAAGLGIAGTASEQTVGGSTVSALVGTQSDVIEVDAEDTLSTIVEKINNGRYGTASVRQNDDGTYSLSVRSQTGGLAGQLAINTQGFDLDLDTGAIGQDAAIAVTDASGVNRLLTSSDGVFEIDSTDDSTAVSSTSLISQFGSTGGSFTIADSSGATAAINVTVEGIETVGELVDRINELGIGVTASINEQQNGLQIIDNAGGEEDLVITDVGNGRIAASLGFAGTAETLTIDEVEVTGISGQADSDDDADTTGLVFTLKELSEESITVTVGEDTDAVTKAAKTFADQFNRLVDELDRLTFFDGEANEVGLLFGSSEALRISNGYSRLLSGTIRGAGDFSSLGQVGLRMNDEGKLDLNEGELRDSISENREATIAFFTAEDNGLISRMDQLAERLAGDSGSLLLTRTETLTSQIERNDEKVEFQNVRLEAERERLLKQFYAMEESIAKLQGNLGSIESIQRIEFPQ